MDSSLSVNPNISRESEAGDPVDNRYAVVVTALTVILTLFVSICFYRVQQDDAYIIYTYSRNIAAGHGYVFNQGVHFNGTTSALYTLLIAFCYRLADWIPGVTIPIVGHAIGAVSLLATSLVGMRAMRRRGMTVASLAFPFLFLGSPYLPTGAGMETFLTLALITSAFSFYQDEKWSLAAVFSALAVLSRPDSMLVPVVMSAYHLAVRKQWPPMRAIVLFVAVVLPWCVFAYLYFGDILPSTVVTKITQTQSGLWGTGAIFLRGLWAELPSYARFMPLVCLATVAATTALVFGRAKVLRHCEFGALTVIWILAYIGVYAVINPPDYPWYFAPIALGLGVYMALAIESAWRSDWAKARMVAQSDRVLPALIVILLIAAVVPALDTVRHPVDQNRLRYLAASNWLNSHAQANSSVGADEVGVLGYYYTKGPIVDALGLVTPGVARHVKNRDFDWYIHSYRPDYLMMHQPYWPGFEGMTTEAWFAQQYSPVASFPNKLGAAVLYRRRNGV